MPRFYSRCAGLNFPIEQPSTVQNDKGQVVTLEPRRIAFNPLHSGVIVDGTLVKFGIYETEDPVFVAALQEQMKLGDVITEEQYLKESKPTQLRAEEAESALAEAKRQNALLVEQLKRKNQAPQSAA